MAGGAEISDHEGRDDRKVVDGDLQGLKVYWGARINGVDLASPQRRIVGCAFLNPRFHTFPIRKRPCISLVFRYCACCKAVHEKH